MNLSPSNKDIGNRIRIMREVLGMNQVALQQKAGMGLGKLSSIETGKIALTMKDSFQICAALDFNPSDLVAGNEAFAFAMADRLLKHLNEKGGAKDA